MRISNLEAWAIELPFKLSFAHALASRNNSMNVIVKATIVSDDGVVFTGYGESVPRDYVTGETVDGAIKNIEDSYVQLLTNFEFTAPLEALIHLRKCSSWLQLDEKPVGASWCAVELAVIDAVCKASGFSFPALLSIYEVTKKKGTLDAYASSMPETITYGGVIPFGGLFICALMLIYYRFLGLKTVKIKVGRDLETDLLKLKIARKILGEDAILRIDANCAWTVEETIYFADKMRKYNVNSIEQPVDAENIYGMQKLTNELPETIVADESLCTLKQAKHLIENRACDAFNIRLSKVGGPLMASEIADLARKNGLSVMLGAQVGESAILSLAARGWAAVKGPFDNCEGSFNRYLLKQDVSDEDVTLGRGGKAPVYDRSGFGVNVDEWRLKRMRIQKPSTSQSDQPTKARV